MFGGRTIELDKTIRRDDTGRVKMSGINCCFHHLAPSDENIGTCSDTWLAHCLSGDLFRSISFRSVVRMLNTSGREPEKSSCFFLQRLEKYMKRCPDWRPIRDKDVKKMIIQRKNKQNRWGAEFLGREKRGSAPFVLSSCVESIGWIVPKLL